MRRLLVLAVLGLGAAGCGPAGGDAQPQSEPTAERNDLAAQVEREPNLVVAPAGVPRWQLLSDSNSASMRSLNAVDLGSVQQLTPTIRRTWTASMIAPLKPAADDAGPMTLMALQLFDCTNRLTQSVSYVTHSGDGQVRQEKPGGSFSSDVLPGTVGETQWLAVCHPENAEGLPVPPNVPIHEFFTQRVS